MPVIYDRRFGISIAEILVLKGSKLRYSSHIIMRRDMAKRKPLSGTRAGAGPKGRRVKNPIEQRSPRDQGTGGYDPDDYHGSGPIPVGNAPHSGHREESDIPIGIGSDHDSIGNPGDVPNTDSPTGPNLTREALGDSVKPDEALKKASKTAA